MPFTAFCLVGTGISLIGVVLGWPSIEEKLLSIYLINNYITAKSNHAKSEGRIKKDTLSSSGFAKLLPNEESRSDGIFNARKSESDDAP
jgi:hypothetical protein